MCFQKPYQLYITGHFKRSFDNEGLLYTYLYSEKTVSQVETSMTIICWMREEIEEEATCKCATIRENRFRFRSLIHRFLLLFHRCFPVRSFSFNPGWILLFRRLSCKSSSSDALPLALIRVIIDKYSIGHRVKHADACRS